MKDKVSELVLVAFMVAVAFGMLFYFSGFIRDFQGSDTAVYADVARNILEKGSAESTFVYGAGISAPSMIWKDQPMYVYTLALFFWVFGVSFWTLKLVGVIFGALLVVPTYYLAKAVFDKNRAMVAAVFAFMYPLLILGAIVPGDKIFAAFVVTSAVCVLAQRANKVFFFLLAGVFSGLAFLTRFDYGGALFLAGLLSEFLGAHLDSKLTLKRRLITAGAFTAAFILTILPWSIRSQMVLGYAYAITGNTARMLTGAPIIPISLTSFVLVFGLFYFVGAVFSVLLLTLVGFLRRRNVSKSLNRATFPLVLVASVAVVILGYRTGLLNFVAFLFYRIPQGLYQASPLVFVLAGVGLLVNVRRVGLFHPTYLFLFLIVLVHTVLGGYMGVYSIPYVPLFLVFAAAAIFDIWSAYSSSRYAFSFRPRLLSSKLSNVSLTDVLVVFMVGSVVLSFAQQYPIIVYAEHMQDGPFSTDNWNKAYDWILANTTSSDSILARYPVVSFYAARRTVLLIPTDVWGLLSLIKSGGVSYMVVDRTAYVEGLVTKDSLMPWLYDYPSIFGGFKPVYQVEDPRLLIFDVRDAPTQPSNVMGWIEQNFTGGWIVDPGLTFASNGREVEMSYDNTLGNLTVWPTASKNLPEPLKFADYPFILVRYRFQNWTTPIWPPPLYFRVFYTNSSGYGVGSNQAPAPANLTDYGWHDFVWVPKQSDDITTMTLMIRVEAGTRFSVVVDFIALSKWPIYFGGGG